MKRNQRTKKVAIEGMHCASCEVLIERKLRGVEGVESVTVDQPSGTAKITFAKEPTAKQLEKALKGTDYRLASSAPEAEATDKIGRVQNYQENIRVIILVLIGYIILKSLDFVPKGLGIEDTMSYGFIFVIGLVAAVSSCIAVTGGLLLAVSSRYAEAHPETTGMKRFRPHLFFNAGRVLGYTVLGGLVGALGSAFTLSTRMTGVLSIVASIVMIFLGFQLLNIFPGLRRFQPKMPKFIAHRVHDASGTSDHPAAPFILGASTFFLPCGFTQALQLYVLSRGSFTVGALTMLVFSLGTLPALLSLSALSSFLKGATQRYFLRFAGVVVILIGMSTIGNGFTLMGTNISLGTILRNNQAQSVSAAELPPIQNVKQIISMKVVGLDYTPSVFKVRQGIPVEWHIDGVETSGCSTVVTAPDLDITQPLPRDREAVVTFTPTKLGRFPFSCPMGMTTRGASITVVENDTTVQGTAKPADPTSTGEIMSRNVQQFNLVSTARGFSPTRLTARKNIPVELTVDVTTPLSGCMNTMIGSDYDIAQSLKTGKNIVRFTPTKTGELYLTCPMGVEMTTFVITE